MAQGEGVMKELLNIYRAALREHGGCFTLDAQPVQNADGGHGRSTLADVQHLLWMLDQMEAMLADFDGCRCGNVSPDQCKFHRWLGFVQGWMWHQHVFTLDELREQTRKALQ